MSGVHGHADDDHADESDEQDTVDDAHESDVDAHVTVEDMGKLVSHDTLEFIAGEFLHAATRDTDDSITAGRSHGRG